MFTNQFSCEEPYYSKLIFCFLAKKSGNFFCPRMISQPGVQKLLINNFNCQSFTMIRAASCYCLVVVTSFEVGTECNRSKTNYTSTTYYHEFFFANVFIYPFRDIFVLD